MTKQILIHVRSNCKFALNYENSNLVPEAELILLSSAPKYEWNKQGKIAKGQTVEEFRINIDLASVNRLIGELQLLAQQMSSFDQLSGSINTIIENSKTKSEKH
jgi:hypothetical protein